MMKERPILFSEEMVRAILDGRKTQTRRLVKNATGQFWDHAAYRPVVEDGRIDRWVSDDPIVIVREGAPRPACPHGVPGDRLWVKETALPDAPMNGWSGELEWDGCGRAWDGVPSKYRKPRHVIYRASWGGQPLTRWNPSIHMPRWASRLTLEVTGVRVERLQDISLADAIAEGIDTSRFVSPRGFDGSELKAVIKYAELWEAINGPGSWAANPWVWVVEFKKQESPK